jgi:hypothetical protein
MKRVMHQLATKANYVPNWPIKHLFLGTFNPEGGDEVNYYYGRESNQFWPILRALTDLELNLNNPTTFLKELKQKGIGCIDMIHELDVPENKIQYVTGKGFSDSKIINTCIERTYNTERINQLISANKGVQVFSTWGKGSNLKEWRKEVEKIKGVIPLVSPSMAARVPKGTKKFEFMLDDWCSKINFN